MKISGPGMNKIINLYGEHKREIGAVNNKVTKDSVEISSLGKSLSSFLNSSNVYASSEKIEELRSAVSQGTYKVDASLTARRILEIMKGREV